MATWIGNDTTLSSEEERNYTTPTSSFQKTPEEQMESNSNMSLIDPDIGQPHLEVCESSEHGISSTKLVWVLNKEENSEILSASFQDKGLTLGHGEFSTVIKYPYLNELKSAILLLKGDSQFYLAQVHLRENSFIDHFVPDLEHFIVKLLKDDSTHKKVQETVLLLHSIYSLLHNDKLSSSFIHNLMDALMFNIIDPVSRCSSGSQCYLLKDIIADIIVTVFKRHRTEELWNETILKVCNVFINANSLVQYGAIVLYFSNEAFIKTVTSSCLENYCKDMFCESLNNSPLRQRALNEKNRLLLAFKYWIKYWLHSESLEDNYLLKSIKFIIDSYLHGVNSFYYFRKDELVQYCILPAKYMCHRMPKQTNASPFSSLSYLLMPSKQKITAAIKNVSNKYPSFAPKMSASVLEEFYDEEEEPFLSEWSEKVDLEVITLSSEEVYLNVIHSEENSQYEQH